MDSERLNYLQLVALKQFHKILIELLKRKNTANRDFNTQEINLLNQFKQPNRPFSLMFKILLEKYI